MQQAKAFSSRCPQCGATVPAKGRVIDERHCEGCGVRLEVDRKYSAVGPIFGLLIPITIAAGWYPVTILIVVVLIALLSKYGQRKWKAAPIDPPSEI